jgi:CO/xanthine dehydrogenase Mo-binding subunit
MGVEGIGASVVRKEDRRFITGRGRYVDDIKLQGMTHAHFVRSPQRSCQGEEHRFLGGHENARRGRRAHGKADRR